MPIFIQLVLSLVVIKLGFRFSQVAFCSWKRWPTVRKGGASAGGSSAGLRKREFDGFLAHVRSV